MANQCTQVPTAEDPQASLPYNEFNVIIGPEDVLSIFQKFGLQEKPHNINYYRTAMVHRSYCTRKNENFINGNTQCPENCMPLQEESNERLEFLGDAVVNLIIGKYLFDRYPDENEGFLTKLRTKLVNGNMLAQLCDYTNIHKFIILSKQIEANNGRLNKKILEDTFEAFVGAIFNDFNDLPGYNALDVVQQWLITMIEENIDFSELISTNKNYKDVFLKYYQHTHNYIPKFYEISSDTTNNGKIYTVSIKDNSRNVISTGKGPTKKYAENDASYNALVYLGAL